MTETLLESLLADAPPEEAMDRLIATVRAFLPLLGEERRREFIRSMFGAPGDDKIVSMVHL